MLDAFEGAWRCSFCDAELTGEVLASGVHKITFGQIHPQTSKKETTFIVCNNCEVKVSSSLGKALFFGMVHKIARSHKERQAADLNEAPSPTN